MGATWLISNAAASLIICSSSSSSHSLSEPSEVLLISLTSSSVHPR